MTFNEARTNAQAKIATKDDALNVAIEMLESIAKGKTYDAVEYFAVVEEMRRLRNVELLAAVRAHALKFENYEHGGWDVVIECYEDSDILGMIGNATTVDAAIKNVAKSVVLFDSVRRDVQAEAF